MTRKDILVFGLREIRNELADALDGLVAADYAVRPIPGRNPIGWIVCHCMKNIDFFIHERQTGRSLLGDDGPYGAIGRYATKPPSDENPAPAFDGLAAALDDVYARSIAVIAGLPEAAFDAKPPFWHREEPESTAGTCVRVVNHGNAHLRQICVLRGAMGNAPWPVQTLVKQPGDPEGKFLVPDRAAMIARRAARR